MVGTFFAGVLGGFLISSSAREAWFDPFFGPRWAGVGILMCGWLLRKTAVDQLGAAFSLDPEVRPDQKLKTDGLFKRVRHPAYTGDLIGYAGIALAFWHPVTSCLAFVLPTLGLLYRVKVEEDILVDAFGDEYVKYQRVSKRLIPFIF
jgi:protein-S-isoprenylcysteine O-methyltransferase Ste14